MPSSTSASSPYRVQSLDRACDILECLGVHGPDLALSEITAHLGLSKSTVHRLLAALEQRQFVRQNALKGKYSLGTKLFELGLKAVGEQGLIAAARPRLTTLVASTGETAHLGVLREGMVLSICSVESPHTLRTPSTVGRLTPAHSSSLGKCILAFGRPEELELVLRTRGLDRFTLHTITDERQFRRELDRVRGRGYAVDEEEYERGLKCIGAPVRGAAGRAVAAVSIAGPANRLEPGRTAELAAAVQKAAALIASDLGYQNCRRVAEKEGSGPRPG